MISPLLLSLLFAADPRIEADRLVEEGAALGQKGQWDEAIERFEAADAIFPRAMHACNIGLAHARASRPEHALLKLTSCQARTTEPLPSWVDKRIVEARELLTKGSYAPVELVAAPGTQVTIAHFGKAVFTPPITVWLPLGQHRLHAEAANKVPLDEVIDLTPKAPLRRELVLDVMPAPDPIRDPDPVLDPITEPTPPQTVTRSVSRAPAWITLGVGAGLLATGAVFHFVAKDSRDEAEGFTADDARYKSARSDFVTERDLSTAFFIGGGVVAATGVVLAFVLPSEEVVVVPAPNGVSAFMRF